MDGLGAAASVIAVAGLAIQSIQTIKDTIDSVRNVPETLRHIRGDLGALEPLLRTLNVIQPNREQAPPGYEQLTPALKGCQDTCEKFQAQLQSWVRESSGVDNPGKLDSLSIGLLRTKEIRVWGSKLSSCKETLTLIMVANT